MTGGFTRIPKLKTDLGTEGTGDRMPLFNSDGELVGYTPMGSGFLPLSGGVMTGDIEFEGLGGSIDPYTPKGIKMDALSIKFFPEDNYIEVKGTVVFEGDENIINFNGDGGIGATALYVKSNSFEFAQLGDIAIENKTLTPLSLSDLNTEYPTQPTGFQVICNAISLIYIKRTLSEWESIATTTVV